MAISLPALLRGFRFIGKFACIFLLSIAVIGCSFVPSSTTADVILAKASQPSYSPIIGFDATPVPSPITEIITLPLLQTPNQQNTQPKPDTPAPILIKPKSITPKSNLIVNKIAIPPEPSTPPAPVPPIPTPPKNLSITISKIGLNQAGLAYGTNRNIPVIDKLLHNSPVVESQDAVEICSESGNSYIFGHSAPPDTTNPGQAGYIFSNLDILSAGDIIELVTASGQQCKYKVDKWDRFTVDSSSAIEVSEYYRAMQYPDKPTASSLTIQTCLKGSNTVRLLLRASRV